MGFEPMIRVLQTLALPLGHVAMVNRNEKSGRWDSNPRPSPWQGDILPTEPRPHLRKNINNTECHFSIFQIKRQPWHIASVYPCLIMIKNVFRHKNSYLKYKWN
jgi:hypothetical protein